MSKWFCLGVHPKKPVFYSFCLPIDSLFWTPHSTMQFKQVYTPAATHKFSSLHQRRWLHPRRPITPHREPHFFWPHPPPSSRLLPPLLPLSAPAAKPPAATSKPAAAPVKHLGRPRGDFQTPRMTPRRFLFCCCSKVDATLWPNPPTEPIFFPFTVNSNELHFELSTSWCFFSRLSPARPQSPSVGKRTFLPPRRWFKKQRREISSCSPPDPTLRPILRRMTAAASPKTPNSGTAAPAAADAGPVGQ